MSYHIYLVLTTPSRMTDTYTVNTISMSTIQQPSICFMFHLPYTSHRWWHILRHRWYWCVVYGMCSTCVTCMVVFQAIMLDILRWCFHFRWWHSTWRFQRTRGLLPHYYESTHMYITWHVQSLHVDRFPSAHHDHEKLVKISALQLRHCHCSPTCCSRSWAWCVALQRCQWWSCPDWPSLRLDDLTWTSCTCRDRYTGSHHIILLSRAKRSEWNQWMNVWCVAV